MAFDEKAAARLRRLLTRHRSITEKKMMGALCFMANGTMCCGVTGDALMIRVGRENFAAMLARPHVRPLKIGKRAARGFILIDPPGYRTSGALATWIEQGLATAKTLGRKSAKRPVTKRQQAVK